jgi:hypothetical protein
MADYYVVPLTHKQYRDFGKQEFILRIDEVIFQSMLRFKRQPEMSSKVVTLQAFLYDPTSPNAPHLIEYNSYDLVLFLNEGCMKLYEDVGINLKVLRIIPKENLPDKLDKMRTGSYLPN